MPSRPPVPTSWASRSAGLLLALMVPLSATACTSGSDPSASPERLSRNDGRASLASNPPVPTTTKIQRVFGRLPDARRKVVRQHVGKVVDRWWDAAFLGGTYPRSNFPSAFPGFTDGAEKRARDDKALLTNQTRGPHIDSVSATRRSVSIDILATDQQARTVTAAFVLRFESTGDRAGTTTVRGRLFLTYKRGAWRIFGYDVAKGST